MKISQETNEFKPITIVLETREEAQEFYDIVGFVDNGSNLANTFYKAMEKLLYAR